MKRQTFIRDIFDYINGVFVYTIKDVDYKIEGMIIESHHEEVIYASEGNNVPIKTGRRTEKDTYGMMAIKEVRVE